LEDILAINKMLYLEIDALCLGVLVLLLSRLMLEHTMRYAQFLYRSLVLSACIICLADMGWKLVDGQFFPGARELNLAANCLFYIFCSLSSYLWFLYSENEQRNRRVTTRKGCLLYALPFFVLVLMNEISLYNGGIFWVDGQNQWQRGPYFYLQLVLFNSYIFITVGRALYGAWRTEVYVERQKLLALSAFVLPPVTASFMAVWLKHIPTTCASITFSILWVYITLMEQQISLDPLTRLNNRHELHKYLQEAVKRCRNNGRLYLVVLDIDSFKSINDQYGHVEGDKALLRLAAALKETSKTFNCFIARYGGDEFILLHEAADPDELEALTGKLHQSLEKLNQAEASPYKLTVSLGYARYEPPLRNDEDLIAAADVKLYEAKRNKIR